MDEEEDDDIELEEGDEDEDVVIPTEPGSNQGPTLDGKILAVKRVSVEMPDLIVKGMRKEKEMCLKSEQEDYSCQSELEFLTPEDAKALKLPVGTTAALHKCVRPGSKEGAFIPVETSAQAMEVGASFCGCVGDASAKSGHRKKCARSK